MSNNKPPAPIWGRQKTYDELHESAAMGGSFNCAIIQAFFKADPNNTRRLIEAFPDVFRHHNRNNA